MIAKNESVVITRKIESHKRKLELRFRRPLQEGTTSGAAPPISILAGYFCNNLFMCVDGRVGDPAPNDRLSRGAKVDIPVAQYLAN